MEIKEVYLVISDYRDYTQIKSVCSTLSKATETFNLLDSLKAKNIVKEALGTLNAQYTIYDDKCNIIYQEHTYVKKMPLME